MTDKPKQTHHLQIQIDATNLETVLTVLQIIGSDIKGDQVAGNGGSHLTDYVWELTVDESEEDEEPEDGEWEYEMEVLE